MDWCMWILNVRSELICMYIKNGEGGGKHSTSAIGANFSPFKSVPSVRAPTWEPNTVNLRLGLSYFASTTSIILRISSNFPRG